MFCKVTLSLVFLKNCSNINFRYYFYVLKGIFLSKTSIPTRERLLDAAESLIIERGFAGASVDRIIRRTGVTKGSFFHHFASKAELAEAVLIRFAAKDMALLDDITTKAARLSDDPTQRLLLTIGLFAEILDQLDADAPMCMFAAYTFQRMEYPEGAARITQDAIESFRAKLRPLYQAAVAQSNAEVAVDDLIDHLIIVFEGAFVLLTIDGDAALPGRHLRLHRDMLAKMLV